MLLNNANVDDSQRVAIISAATPTDTDVSKKYDNDAYFKDIQYSAVASVLRKCNHKKNNTSQSSVRYRTLGSGSASFRGKGRKKPKLTSNQLSNLK